MSLIEIRGLSKSFGKNVVLDNVDLDINEGEVVAIIGPSGTGKSTLLRSLNLLEKPEAGTVTIDGKTFDLTTKVSKEKLELRKQTEKCHGRSHGGQEGKERGCKKAGPL